ncbi:MAG: BatA domain-containing protein [Verrucomicrobiales bacterium]|nr:BatA domain-containing protein [Verrucomicrobiales bacterium]
MSFLQPWMLAALPLVLLPVVIHLIHLHRRKPVRWAAMMFLRAAQRLNQGLTKLRQYLILALRLLAVAALILMAGRPLAGGLLGLTGGAPDTVLLLVDRSASMAARNVVTDQTKLETGVQRLTEAIQRAYGRRSHLVVLDGATREAVEVIDAAELVDLPRLQQTETAGDIPALLEAALDYVTTQQTGRTDIWVLSDLRQSDWSPGGGRWEAVRAGFSALPGVRFHVLGFPELPEEDLELQLERSGMRVTARDAAVTLDLTLRRPAGPPEVEREVPLRVTVNGVTSVMSVTLRDAELRLQGRELPLDGAVRQGWGVIELPEDADLGNNRAAFVFGEPPPLRSVVVAEDAEVAAPLVAALSASLEAGREYSSTHLPPARSAEIPWEETALVVWQAEVPVADSATGRLLREHAEAGRAVLFLPPPQEGGAAFAGMEWGPWEQAAGEQSVAPGTWRNDAGLLMKTRDGQSLPVGELAVRRWREPTGEGVDLARLPEAALLRRSLDPAMAQVWFLGTLPTTAESSLAREGVVLFALLHRALEAGTAGLGRERQRLAEAGALGAVEEAERWHCVSSAEVAALPVSERALHVAVFERPEEDGAVRRLALQRPAEEDAIEVLLPEALEGLFAGLDYRWVESSVNEEQDLASEVWRTFLILMAGALLVEALLCLPGRVKKNEPGGAVVA